MLTLEDGKALITLARESIVYHFSKKEPKLDAAVLKRFSTRLGAFVNIYINDKLRGSMGYHEPLYPLYEAVVKAAKSAAFSDPRYPSLGRNELDKITIEVSVLSPPRVMEVRNPEDYLTTIQAGKEGVVVKGLFDTGILLPQTAIDNKWDVKTFIEQACLQGGMKKDVWLDFSQTYIYKFQCQAFREKGANKEVVQRV